MKHTSGGEIGETRLNAFDRESPQGAAVPLRSSRAIQDPLIEVSESDGAFTVYADFRSVMEVSGAEESAVEFARQGIILSRGPVQRYVPLPTDAQLEHAKVSIDGGIVRMSVPTADLGHRWRSIVMW